MNAYLAVELFHLVFLRHLGDRLERNLYALKGGCNLRFYFKSIRYSEDIDIDVHTASVQSVRNSVRKVLALPSFTMTLRARGIEIVSSSEPKQSETTQRWKLALRIGGAVREIPTKIEFSRRENQYVGVVEPVDPELVALHKLYPIIAPHYNRQSALQQKISALINRSETQARDIFDLILLSRAGAVVDRELWSASDCEQACEHALSIGFDHFKGQVVAYLEPNYQSYYDSSTVWNAMIDELVNKVLR
jgi:predicted nucleotidyltransferase component of viral defense system